MSKPLFEKNWTQINEIKTIYSHLKSPLYLSQVIQISIWNNHVITLKIKLYIKNNQMVII